MFSWSGRPGPGTSLSASASRTGPSSPISRNAHLASYLNHSVLKPSTRKVSSDDTIYDTVFQTTSGFALILRVYLPADSGRAPSLTLHGVQASHSWLDIRMKVIGYGPISTDQRWKSSSMKLGDAVYAVIHHFQLTPPSVLEITDVNLKRLQETLPSPSNNAHRPPQNSFPPSTSANFQRSNGSLHAENIMANQRVPNDLVEERANFEVDEREVNACVDSFIPSIPHSFPQIENMSLSDLKDMMKNKSVLKSFVESMSEVRTLKELKQSVETTNVNTANVNLAYEEKVETVCNEVESLKEDLNAKIKQYRKLDTERVAITHPPDPQDAIHELNKAKKYADRESEELADEWVESGGHDVSDFVKRFMGIRVLYHIRAAKVERLEMTM